MRTITMQISQNVLLELLFPAHTTILRLGLLRVLTAYRDTPVSQNAEITRKSPSSTIPHNMIGTTRNCLLITLYFMLW